MLYEKSGSVDKFFKFWVVIKVLVVFGELFDYCMVYDFKVDNVMFYVNGFKGYWVEIVVIMKGLFYILVKVCEKVYVCKCGRLK